MEIEYIKLKLRKCLLMVNENLAANNSVTFTLGPAFVYICTVNVP